MIGLDTFGLTTLVWLTRRRFTDARELSARTVLAVRLNALLDARGLTQVEVARITVLSKCQDTGGSANLGERSRFAGGGAGSGGA